MERIRFITHSGHRVLFIDMTGCTPVEVAGLSTEIPEHVMKEPPGSVLILADLSGAEFSKEALARMKLAVAKDKPFLKRSAWIISNNLPREYHQALRSFSGRDLHLFSSREEALGFLVEAEMKSQAS